MSRWGDEKTTQFIHLYRQHECLWNPSSPLYKNKVARDYAYNKIQEAFKLPVQEIKNKIKSLRSTYHQELKKVDNSKSTGNGSSELYKPNLAWFKEMEFLNDTFEHRRSIQIELQLQPSLQTTVKIEPPESSSETCNSTVEPPQSTSQHTSVSPQQSFTQTNVTRNDPPTTSASSTKKTVQNKRKHDKNQTLSTLQRLEKISAAINTRPKEDEFYYFGQNVAAQLRSLPLHDALDLQSKIQMLISTERTRLSTSYSQPSTQYSNTDSDDTADPLD
ncbi:uncharacterized protein LOC128678380 [Plodia interpunctella]|uniref:uncharacterized protein LOC128678380 n=1 Tax=Plodia interpunctella TaxID=58824 RepID=UPI002367C158|nr:uncharacterized protein LOC128678380 [Plodia interpunctella]